MEFEVKPDFMIQMVRNLCEGVGQIAYVLLDTPTKVLYDTATNRVV